MTRYIVCSNKEFNFDFQVPIRIPEIEACHKPLSSRLPRNKHNYTRWAKSHHRVPDKEGVYQVLDPSGKAKIYYARWDGTRWSLMAEKPECFTKDNAHNYESPLANQFKTWRGLTTASYLAAG